MKLSIQLKIRDWNILIITCVFHCIYLSYSCWLHSTCIGLSCAMVSCMMYVCLCVCISPMRSHQPREYFIAKQKSMKYGDEKILLLHRHIVAIVDIFHPANSHRKRNTRTRSNHARCHAHYLSFYIFFSLFSPRIAVASEENNIFSRIIIYLHWISKNDCSTRTRQLVRWAPPTTIKTTTHDQNVL